ncbi:hypothetical protein SAMN05216436_11753 [bacterium A37T11]|nr:hypothetical protein SAMN05216436_11753 [bacterium A37T11]
MKTNKYINRSEKRSHLLAFALTGLAVGTIAYLLFGTKGGRKQWNNAVDHIRDLTDTIRDKAKDGLGQASSYASKALVEARHLKGKAKEGIEDFADEATKKGKHAARKAEELAQELADKAHSKA